MEILVSKNGKRFGPYSEAQVNGYIKQGHFTASDLAWHKGIAKWAPLGEVINLDSSVPPPIPSREKSAYNGGFSPADILAIAFRQKAILWLILAQLTIILVRIWFMINPRLAFAERLTSPFLSWIPLTPLLLFILSPIFVFRLARSVRVSPAWLIAFFSLIPLVGLFVLLSINSTATGLLKGRHIRVGLMGANKI